MLRLLTLGGLDVRRADGRAVAGLLKQPKRAAVLAYLAVRGGFLRRNALLGVFWPDSDESRARATLRTTLHYLRGQLPEEAIEARGDEELRIDPARAWCDAVAFREAIANNRLDEALTLYRGPLLDGFLPPGIPEFNDWLARERQTYARQAADAARTLYTRAHNAEDDHAAVSAARRWVELAPYEEPAIRALAAALADTGNRTGALDALESWKSRVAAELGAVPGADTLAIERHLRSSMPTGGDAGRNVRDDVDAARIPDAPAAVPQASVPRARPRIRPIGVVMIVTAVITIGVVATLMTRDRSAARAEAVTRPLSVAVLPFAYGGDPEYAYLRLGLVDLLSARLNAVTDIPVTDPRAVLGQYERFSDADAALSPVAGRTLGTRLGAAYFVLGSLVELNGRLSLSATLYDASGGKEIAQVALVGTVEELFELVDQAAYALVRTHVPGAAGGAPGSTAAYRTSSPEALRHFIDGEVAFTRGRYADAVAAYDRATSADSTFARAWLRMSMAGTWQNSWATTRIALEHALRHAQRLSVDERLLLQAWRAHVLDARPLVADSLYRAYLARHPEDAEAWLQLGEVRFHWGPTMGISPRAARNAFDRALNLLPNHVGGLAHQVRLSARFAPPRSTDSLYRALGAQQPDRRDVIEAGMIAALAARDSARIAAILPDMDHLDDAARLALAHTLTAVAADMRLAERSVFGVTRARARDAEFDARHIDLLIAAGRVRAADSALIRMKPDLAAERAALQAVLPFLPPDRARITRARNALIAAPDAPLGDIDYYDVPEFQPGVSQLRKQLLLALLDARAGNTASAQSRASTLARTGTDVDRMYGERFATLIEAMLAGQANEPARALELLGPPRVEPFATYPRLSSYFLAFERWLRADALARTERTTDAIRWLETFPDNSGYDVAWAGAALLRLSELYAAAGRTADARWALQRVEVMWRDADPMLAAQLDQVRARCGAACSR